MPLQLTSLTVLPDGIHDCTLEEVYERFGRDRSASRRTKLCNKLREYVDKLRAAGMFGWLILDGSFVMGCVEEPDDIDLIFVLPKAWDMKAELNPHQYNLLSKKNVKRQFPFDLFPVREGSVEEQKWIEFFSQINVKWCDEHGFSAHSTKGLARIQI